MRDRFLSDPSAKYWTDPRDLELYDTVFAERIGWKWDAVLQSLEKAGWKSFSQRIFDWGCGTGVASRKVSAHTGIGTLRLHDRASEAVRFAVSRSGDSDSRQESPPERFEPGTLLLISHVLNELPSEALNGLVTLAASADEVIWVEPGTHEVSRKLGAIRDRLIGKGQHMIAPCIADIPCPMLTPERERDWCHFFAAPPNEIFHSSFWREVNLRLEIDLRSLPYSYFAASRNWQPHWGGGVERMIGRPREFKAHCELLCCGKGGLNERVLQKRDEPALYKAVAKGRSGNLFEWEMDPDKPGKVRAGREMEK